jgi:hypothetical protein
MSFSYFRLADLNSQWQTFGRLFIKGSIKMVCWQTFSPYGRPFGSTAFNLTLHSLLSQKLLAAGFPAIFICFFIFVYANQTGCWVLGTYHGIFGYSDDNWLLAPSLSALHDMLSTSHKRCSTDPNPTKCQTKLMAFLKDPRELPATSYQPWVDQLKNLGNIVSNTINGGQLDIKIKRAKYIDKNKSLLQEFYFAHPQTKVKVNNIYNSHFSGSQLWKFGSNELGKFESTYNKLM